MIRARARFADPFSGMSGAEKKWAQILTASKLGASFVYLVPCQVHTWRPQAVTFHLAKGTSYRPDFQVIRMDGLIEYQEIKQEHRLSRKDRAAGRKSSPSTWRPSARVKFKAAAERHPEFLWVALELQLDGSWKRTESEDLFKRTAS